MPYVRPCPWPQETRDPLDFDSLPHAMTAPARPTSPHSPASNSFPIPPDAVSESDARSAISSRMSDMDSQYGGVGAAADAPPVPTLGARSSAGRLHGLTGPVGEPGLPPSRPSSRGSVATGRSSKPGAWSQASPSRGNSRRAADAGTGSVAGSVGAASTRPPTAASRTHVPSLTSHAFLHPMSSQRLQAQRNSQRSSILGGASPPPEMQNELARNPNRTSTGSVLTERDGSSYAARHDEDVPLPPTRGTDETDRDIPAGCTANSSPAEARPVMSRGESVAPLQKPPMLDLSETKESVSGALPTPSKSPRSFRSSFILPNRNSQRASRATNHSGMRQQGHEKLASADSSPRLGPPQATRTKEEVKKELGSNYEYFTGNTVFCWGGRLQNARDRPINIITGLLVIVPAALFFAFS